MLPERQEHEVLGIGKAELAQRDAVDAVEGAGGGVHREAQLRVEAQRLLEGELCR